MTGDRLDIKSIEPIAVSLPMLKPVIMAGEDVRRADNVLVRIEADDGTVGWGEAASAPVMTGETLESIVAAVHYLSTALHGRDAADITGALAAMDGRMYGNHGAKAAIEIALHDLTGRATQKPVHALLGEKKRSRMPLLGVIGGGDSDGDLRDAERKKPRGVTAYKIKVGIDAPEKDAARTRDICKVLGSGMLISADANQGYTTAQALTYVRAVNGSGLDFFEQPVAAGDLAGMAAVAAATDIAIGADEGIHSLEDIRRHHERKAARGVSLKAIKLGGIRARDRGRRLCDSLGMQREYFLQDRRVEHRLRGGTACRVGHSRHCLGAHPHPHRARRRCRGRAYSDRQRPCGGPRPAGPWRRCRRRPRAALSRGGCRAEWGLAVRHDFSVVMAGLVPAFVTQTLNKSLPGLTRQSMRQRSRKNQYCVRTWNRIMDARVKPAHDK